MPSFRVILGLGSNLPRKGRDSRGLLEDALAILEKKLSSFKVSPFYETEPVGPKDQPFFLNAAASGFYKNGPYRLLEEIQQIEASFGRNRVEERRWGERTLDIDILLYGDLVVSNPPLLEIPHPKLKERRFALEPLLELFPGAEEPGTGISYKDICGALPLQGVKKLSP